MLRIRGRSLTLSLFTLSLVGGCSASTRQLVVKPATLNLDRGAQIVVEIATGPATGREAGLFEQFLLQKLDATGKFSQVDLRRGAAASGDLLVSCQISDIRRVDPEERELLGALAGRASVDVRVTIVEIQSGNGVGEAVVSGLSSGGLHLRWHDRSGDRKGC